MLEEILHKYKTDNFLRPFNNVRVAQNIADHFQSDENIYYDGTGNNYNFNIGSKSIRTQPFSDKIAGLGPQQIVNAGLSLYNHVQSDQNTHICELLLQNASTNYVLIASLFIRKFSFPHQAYFPI